LKLIPTTKLDRDLDLEKLTSAMKVYIEIMCGRVSDDIFTSKFQNQTSVRNVENTGVSRRLRVSQQLPTQGAMT